MSPHSTELFLGDNLELIMSAVESFYTYLAEGNIVTTRAARAMFKVEHVSTLVYRLRNAGVPVYTNRYTTSRGERTFAYRIGTPNEAFTNALATRHKARARKSLYRQAVGA
jgi:hypothetical protein